MTKAQKMWVKTQQKLQGAAEPAKANYYPEDENRAMVYKVVEREEFEWFIMAVIVMNAVTMACERYDASDDLRTTLDGLGVFFAVIFVGEAAAKLYAMYPAAYFSDRWNCFDFFCVATTLIGYMAGTGGGASVLRVLRLARVFRLVRKLKGLLMLFNTLIVSLPGLINIGALLFLLCFVYAVLGMNLFGKVKFGENLNEDANFTNFGNSILILLRMVTGEGVERHHVRLHGDGGVRRVDGLRARRVLRQRLARPCTSSPSSSSGASSRSTCSSRSCWTTSATARRRRASQSRTTTSTRSRWRGAASTPVPPGSSR